MAGTGIVVLAHGSRGERGKGEVEAVLKKIASNIKPLLSQKVEIIGAALQFNKPNLEDAVTALSERDIKRIVIAPYFLFPGRHITEDIPSRINELQRKYVNTEFIVTDNLGLDEAFISLLAKRIKKTVPDLIPDHKFERAHAIERESMKIIDRLITFPSTLSNDEITVLKRMIHASGDGDIVPLVHFSQSAVTDGIASIATSSPVLTDVYMVMAGINGRLAEAFRCPVSCVLDGTDTAPQKNRTRTAAAMSQSAVQLNDAIAVIGNAPTALLALLDLVDRQGVRPALIVGMPVGFVKAAESKQELMKHNIPYITIEGTRGGSAIAAATVNALLTIAAAKYL